MIKDLDSLQPGVGGRQLLYKSQQAHLRGDRALARHRGALGSWGHLGVCVEVLLIP